MLNEMNGYPIIKVPSYVEQDNAQMSLKDVEQYFTWFMSVKDERLRLFCEQVFVSKGVELSSDKLQAIYYFFKENLSVRKRTSEEIEEEREKLPPALRSIHEVPDYELVEPTHSIMFDAGIYFGELLLKEVPGVDWSIERDKKMVNYGKPILIRKEIKNVSLNPSGLFYIMSIQMQKDTIKEDRLSDLYRTWKNSFEGKRKDYAAMVERWSKGKK